MSLIFIILLLNNGSWKKIHITLLLIRNLNVRYEHPLNLGTSTHTELLTNTNPTNTFPVIRDDKHIGKVSFISEKLYCSLWILLCSLNWSKMNILPSVHFFLLFVVVVVVVIYQQTRPWEVISLFEQSIVSRVHTHLPLQEDATCAWCLHHLGSLFESASTSGGCLCSALITKPYRFSEWQGIVTYQHWKLSEKPLLI